MRVNIYPHALPHPPTPTPRPRQQIRRVTTSCLYSRDVNPLRFPRLLLMHDSDLVANSLDLFYYEPRTCKAIHFESNTFNNKGEYVGILL